MDELTAHIAAVGRRLRLRDGVELAARTLWVPLALAALALALARLLPLAGYRLWAWLPLVLWAVGLSASALARRQRPLDVARRADRELDLRERLSTALVGRSSASPMPSGRGASRRGCAWARHSCS